MVANYYCNVVDNKQAAKPQQKKSGAKKATKPKGASQALKAQKAVKKGTNTGRVRKVRTSVHFRRPKTLELARNPKYPRNSVPKKTALDQVSTVSAMRSQLLLFNNNIPQIILFTILLKKNAVVLRY